MSHISLIKQEIKDLGILKAACKELGLVFLEGQTTYKWFGEFVGDYPLPEGITRAELGRCVHAIKVPGAAYEVGVVQKNGKWILLWDFWHAGGLERVLGKDGRALKQAIANETVRRAVRSTGKTYIEKRVGNKIRFEITVGR